MNCPELNELKELINFKYGNNVIERAEKNMNNLVDGKILMKFNNLPLSQDVIVNKLVDIKNRLGINTNNNAANNINNNNINVNNSSILTQSFPMFSNHSSKEIELPKSNFSLIKASFTNFDINEEIKKPKHKNVVRNSKTLHLPDLQNIQNKEAIYNDVVVPEVGNLAVYPKNNVNNNENLLRLQRRQEQLQKKKELEAALAQKIHRIQELQKQLNQPKFSDKFNIVANRLLQLPETAYLGLEHEAQISDFNIIKELGKGGFATVYLAVHKLTQAQYAIKAIKKDKIKPKEMLYFRREIEIMYKIHHPNIVKLFGHFEDDSNCYLIMEYLPNGNIYQYVRKNLRLNIIASIIKDLISAVYYLHHMNPPIIHRDIKPENVLIGENFNVKLTDFGWSNYMSKSDIRNSMCGTPMYRAPEILNKTGHNEKVDNWSIGCLLFEMITGKLPFMGFNLVLKNNINNLNVQWPKTMDADAKDIISRIFKYDPNQRLGLREMLMHPFFTKFFPGAVNNLTVPNDKVKFKPFIVSQYNPKNWNPLI